MRFEHISPALAAIAVLLPMPAAAHAPVMISLCNGGTLPLPVHDDGKRDDRRCSLACHATDSRKRHLRDTADA